MSAQQTFVNELIVHPQMNDLTHVKDTSITAFSDYYSLLRHYLVGDVNYEIENADTAFTGRVDALRIVDGKVRFGNVIYQIIFATLVARRLPCKIVGLRQFEMRPIDLPMETGGLTYVAGEDMPKVPTLAGPFFNAYSFGSLLKASSIDFVIDTVDTCLKPLFKNLLDGIEKLDDDVLVLHFRSGDVFREQTGIADYVQPPASFYTKSIEWGQNHLGIKHVRLVYEDRANPAVSITESFLKTHAISYEAQSTTAREDFRTLLSAKHLVAGVGTFCEAAALLSANLQTLISFRNVELFQDHHWASEPFLLSILRARGQKSVVVKDIGKGFIPPYSWLNTPAQVELIAQFPSEHLQIADGTDVRYDSDHLELSLNRALEELQYVRGKAECRRWDNEDLTARNKDLISANNGLNSVNGDLKWHNENKRQHIVYLEGELSKPLILKIVDHLKKKYVAFIAKYKNDGSNT